MPRSPRSPSPGAAPRRSGFLFILLIEGVIVPGHPGHDESPPPPSTAAAQHEVDWHPGGQKSAIYPVILLIVLSVHSVILGLALGAQGAFSGALILFLAIVAHKGAAGLALGVGYQRSGMTYRRAMPQLGFFSAMTPLGIVAGAGIGAVLTGHGSPPVRGDLRLHRRRAPSCTSLRSTSSRWNSTARVTTAEVAGRGAGFRDHGDLWPSGSESALAVGGPGTRGRRVAVQGRGQRRSRPDEAGPFSSWCCGADDGNRTRVASLEDWGSTIELRPRAPRRGDVSSPPRAVTA